MVVATARRMLETYPTDLNVDIDILVRCIEACRECGQTCTQCADACLGEPDRPQDLARCIRLNLDCADVCMVTARMLSRRTGYDADLGRAMLEACAVACRVCGDECEHHAEHGMAHCRICAESCRACEEACRALLSAID
jgi:hypothetical protein